MCVCVCVCVCGSPYSGSLFLSFVSVPPPSPVSPELSDIRPGLSGSDQVTLQDLTRSQSRDQGMKPNRCLHPTPPEPAVGKMLVHQRAGEFSRLLETDEGQTVSAVKASAYRGKRGPCGRGLRGRGLCGRGSEMLQYQHLPAASLLAVSHGAPPRPAYAPLTAAPLAPSSSLGRQRSR